MKRVGVVQCSPFIAHLSFSHANLKVIALFVYTERYIAVCVLHLIGFFPVFHLYVQIRAV